jgi:hypothetical protein
MRRGKGFCFAKSTITFCLWLFFSICLAFLTEVRFGTRLVYLTSALILGPVNIGNARLYGLEEDLGLVGNQYQVAVSILFVTYCV